MLEKLYAMLDTLTNTFEEIDVKGRKNVNLMLGCMGAVDEMKLMILESIKSEKEGTEVEDGGSGDIGTASGNDGK